MFIILYKYYKYFNYSLDSLFTRISFINDNKTYSYSEVIKSLSIRY